jgi:Cu(I)/Ag(I) efflux system protein CusF
MKGTEMKSIVLASLFAAALALPALADDKHHKKEAGASAGAAQGSAMADGEIRKVDKDAKKITIKHGPLEKLDMPAMTMVFQVRDPALLDKVKAGDKVKFEAEKIGGGYAVTKIEPAK